MARDTLNVCNPDSKVYYVCSVVYWTMFSRYPLFPDSLTVASYLGTEEVAKLLLKDGANVNGSLFEGITPIWYAGSNGHACVVKVLLDHEAQIGIGNAHPRPTHEPCRAYEQGYEAVVELLLAHGADTEVLNITNGDTPLLCATRKSYRQILKMLVKYGAKVDATDAKFGATPLHLAVQYGDEVIIQALLDAGADGNALDKLNRAPFKRMTDPDQEALIERLLVLDRKDALTKRLLEFHRAEKEEKDIILGARRLRDEERQFLLCKAVSSGYTGVARWLLEEKFLDPNVSHSEPDSLLGILNGDTPLLHAVRKNHLPVIRILLNKGAKTEPEDTDGLTILHLAAMNGNKEVIEILLQWGANCEAKDRFSRTPYDVAKIRGHDLIFSRYFEQDQNFPDTMTRLLSMSKQ